MSENIGKWARKLDLAFNDIWVLRFATVGALCVAVLFLLPASSLLADVVSWGCMVPVTALIVRFVYLLRLPCGRWKRLPIDKRQVRRWNRWNNATFAVFSLFCSFGYCSVFSVDNISECDGRMSPENDVLPFSILFFVRGRIKARLRFQTRFQRLRFSSRSFCNSYMRSRYFAAARKSSDLAARSISSFAFAISVSRFSPAM